MTNKPAAVPTPMPWTLRAFDALPGDPFRIGIIFTAVLLLLFLSGRILFDGASNSTANDLRVAVTQILMLTYSAAAYAYLLMTVRQTTQDLSPVGGHTANWKMVVDRAGRHPGWILLLVGTASYLIIGIGVTNLTTPAPVDPWAWRNWNYDLYWHRVTTLFFVGWISCFCYAMIVESARLSRLLDHFESLDLLDLDPYRPLVRQGLTNTLLVIGMVSVMSLLGVESRYGPVLLTFWMVFVLLAWAGMMLPLRGIRKQIRMAKDRELGWCRQSLKVARDKLKSGADGQQSIAELLAYRTVIESVRNWPFDNPTLIRFTLYLLIPLGSWLGGALVERGLDLFVF